MILILITLILVLLIVGSLFIGVFGVPYVPSPNKAFEAILNENFVKEGMTVYELGSGTGGFLTFIGKRISIKGIGYEIAPLFWFVSFIRSKLIHKSNIKFLFKSYMSANLSKADIVYVYLLPVALKKLKTVFETMNEKAIIISLDFKIPDKIPIKEITEERHTIYIYKKEA